MKIIPLLLCLVSLSASGIDDTTDWHPTRFTPQMRPHDVIASKRRTIEACQAMGAETRLDHPGCARADLVAMTCAIYTSPYDRDDDEAEIHAHEMQHCFWGRWHDKPL